MGKQISFITTHASDRLAARFKLSEEALLNKLNSSDFISIKYNRELSFRILWSERDNCCLVAMQNKWSGVVVTVWTQKIYTNKTGNVICLNTKKWLTQKDCSELPEFEADASGVRFSRTICPMITLVFNSTSPSRTRDYSKITIGKVNQAVCERIFESPMAIDPEELTESGLFNAWLDEKVSSKEADLNLVRAITVRGKTICPVSILVN